MKKMELNQGSIVVDFDPETPGVWIWYEIERNGEKVHFDIAFIECAGEEIKTHVFDKITQDEDICTICHFADEYQHSIPKDDFREFFKFLGRR